MFSLTNEKILRRIIEVALAEEEQDIVSYLYSKPYGIDFLKVKLCNQKVSFESFGAFILNKELRDKLITPEESVVDLTILKGSGILVVDEETLNEFLNEILPNEIHKITDEENLKTKSADQKIKDCIEENIPENISADSVETIFSLVKESCKNNLLENMGKVYDMIKSQSGVTKIFQSKPELKVDKNTFVAKKWREINEK